MGMECHIFIGDFRERVSEKIFEFYFNLIFHKHYPNQYKLGGLDALMNDTRMGPRTARGIMRRVINPNLLS